MNCVFCERILRRRSDMVWDRTLAETADYAVVPTKGALVPGWLLVVAKEHLLCTGALRSSAMAGLSEAIAVAKGLVESKFGPATLFEHGPESEGTALGCGVDHLHVHVAPLAFSLRAAFQRLYPDSCWKSVADWRDLCPVHAGRMPYIAVQESDEELGWCPAPINVRQPLRRAVATATGARDHFDYNLHPYTENVTRTVELLTAV